MKINRALIIDWSKPGKWFVENVDEFAKVDPDCVDVAINDVLAKSVVHDDNHQRLLKSILVKAKQLDVNNRIALARERNSERFI